MNTVSRRSLNEENPESFHILVVSDSSKRRQHLETVFDGYTVTAASSAAIARDLLDGQHFEAVITDYCLPSENGLDVLGDVRSVQPDTACVLYTDVGRTKIDTSRYPTLVVDYVNTTHPSAVEMLSDTIETAIHERSHTPYPLPSDETERLKVLEEYRDPATAAAESFDRLVSIAKTALGTDAAFVSLLDRHTKEIISGRGIDWTTLDRDQSVCTYSILADSVTMIEDLTEDPRFERLTAVVDDALKSYAGAPLVTPDGYSIGTFCVMDKEPRSFTNDELDMLNDLAEHAMTHLELRTDQSSRANRPKTH